MDTPKKWNYLKRAQDLTDEERFGLAMEVAIIRGFRGPGTTLIARSLYDPTIINLCDIIDALIDRPQLEQSLKNG